MWNMRSQEPHQTTPYIDVMIPFWGDPELLRLAIESVRRQTNPNWRLVVVDDCYPQPVEELVASYGDGRMSYERNQSNLGTTGNYQRCLELCTAPYVMFFGCDDIMLPNYVDLVLGIFSRYPNASIVQPGFRIIDSAGKPALPLRDFVKRFILAPRGRSIKVLRGEKAAFSLARGDWLSWPSLAFRAYDVKRFPFRDGLPIIQDLGLLIDMIIDGCTLVYAPAVAFNWRRHNQSAAATSAVTGRRFPDERRYLSLAADLLQEKGWNRAAWAARLRLLSRLDALTCLPAAIRRGQWVGIKAIFKHAFSIG